MNLGNRPLIAIGNGCRNVHPLLLNQLMDLGLPVVTSWMAADLVNNWHPSFVGRPGIYGQRLANKVVYNADHIISIGCRWSMWQAGYGSFQREHNMTVVDIDAEELKRFPSAVTFKQDAGEWIEKFLTEFSPPQGRLYRPWLDQLEKWRKEFPWLEPHHQHGEYINPHRFVHELGERLKPDAVVVTDCATGNLCAHQILRLKPGQRLMTSGGLGEMGCGLPAAIGASFARGKGEVICLMTDGAMAMNVQELATIRHHNLPIKIIVFCNDGYGMIRGTQRALGMPYSGVNEATGVWCPDYCKVAEAYGITGWFIHHEYQIQDLQRLIGYLLTDDGPALLSVRIDPEYQISPKLQPVRNADGSISNAIYEVMS